MSHTDFCIHCGSSMHSSPTCLSGPSPTEDPAVPPRQTTPGTPATAAEALASVFWSDEEEAPNDPATMVSLLQAKGWTLCREAEASAPITVDVEPSDVG